MEEILKLKLNSNFRDPIDVLGKVSNFKGRENDLSRLDFILKERKSASVLVSGRHGVGKTSLVDEAVRRFGQTSKGNLLPVKLTLASLDTGGRNGEDSKRVRASVLKALIRALYFEATDKIKNKKLKRSFKEIYDKTYFKEEMQRTSLYSDTAKIVTKEQNIKSSKNTLKLSLSKNALRAVKILLGGGISFGLISKFHDLLLQQFGVQAIFIEVIIVFFVLLSIGGADLEAEEKETSKYSSEQEYSGTIEGSMSGKYDNSSDTLEEDLRWLLDRIKDSLGKVIFVIDELDKLPLIKNNTEKEDDVNELQNYYPYLVVKSIKNMFSIPSVVFVFITDQQFYKCLIRELESEKHEIPHTLFTDMMYVSAHHFKDMENVLDGMFSKQHAGLERKINRGDVEAKEKMSVYRKFKNYVCWVGHNHVFDTQIFLEGVRDYADGRGEFIRLFRSPKDKKGNISNDWIMLSGLQKFLGVVYEKQSEQNEVHNELLYLSLHIVLETLYAKGELLVTNGDYLSLVNDNVELAKSMSESDKLNISGAIDILLRKLSRYDVVTYEEELVDNEDAQVKQEKHTFIRDFNYPGSEIVDDTGKAVFEEEFDETYVDVINTRKNIRKIGFGLFEDFDEEIEKLEKYHQEIKDRKPGRSERPSVIKTHTKRLRDIKAKVLEDFFQTFVTSAASEIGFTLLDTVAGPPDLASIEGPQKEFYSVSTNFPPDKHAVLINSENNKSILVALNLRPVHLEKYKKSIAYQTPYRDREIFVVNLLFGSKTSFKNDRGWFNFSISIDLLGMIDPWNKLVDLHEEIQ